MKSFPIDHLIPCDFCGVFMKTDDAANRAKTINGMLHVHFAHHRCVIENEGDQTRPPTRAERVALMRRYFWLPFSIGAVLGTLVSWLVAWSR